MSITVSPKSILLATVQVEPIREILHRIGITMVVLSGFLKPLITFITALIPLLNKIDE